MILGFKKQFVKPILAGTKIHTIREDKGSRWKPGMKIHGATGTRTKNYECFFTGWCVNTQFIMIEPDIRRVYIQIPIGDCVLRHLSDELMLQFVRNDGFDSVEDFWSFWPNRFEGIIIHWTPFYY